MSCARLRDGARFADEVPADERRTTQATQVEDEDREP